MRDDKRADEAFKKAAQRAAGAENWRAVAADSYARCMFDAGRAHERAELDRRTLGKGWVLRTRVDDRPPIMLTRRGALCMFASQPSAGGECHRLMRLRPESQVASVPVLIVEAKEQADGEG